MVEMKVGEMVVMTVSSTEHLTAQVMEKRMVMKLAVARVGMRAAW